MLRNQIISHSRKAKRKFIFESEDVPDIPDEEEIKDHHFYSELYSAIHKIPEQRRKILELAVFESYSYKQIAAHFGISVNTVKTQMGRAYQFLKEELDPKNFFIFHFLLERKRKKPSLDSDNQPF
jgi:RNA polymerase sigma-70 factor (ECF subfamily)